MRRSVLDDLIADILVADEVARLNRPESDLVSLAVESGGLLDEPPVDDAQIEDLYKQSGAAEYGIRLETLRQEFIDVLDEQRAAATRARYRKHLRGSGKIRVLLDPPRTFIPVTRVDPVRGVPDALVTIVEFSDFHCPFCQSTRPVLAQLLQKYAGQVQWVWKNYPLGSATAAVAAACAHAQGRFWDYHDALFSQQGVIAPDDIEALQALATELQLDDESFAGCIAEDGHRERVASDGRLGRALGVTGTPTFFVNGRMVVGAHSFEEFERVVMDEIELVGNED